jgi:hypothetical protein
MLRATIMFALVLQACGPRTAPSEQPDEPASDREAESERDADAGTPSDPRTGCPARFDAAMQGSSCTQDSHCVYPEAECWCQGKQECTGVDLGPEAQTWFEWSCRVSDPAVLRADGCPAKVPERGQPCTSDGQVCVYSPYCGGIQSTARCTGGAWQLEQIPVSAPPSAEG